jgi:hypothetical protein
LEAAGIFLRIAMAVAALAAAVGAPSGVRRVRAWGVSGRAVGGAVFAVVAGALVFALQSLSVGPSPGGAILALAAGTVTLLMLVLVRGV